MMESKTLSGMREAIAMAESGGFALILSNNISATCAQLRFAIKDPHVWITVGRTVYIHVDGGRIKVISRDDQTRRRGYQPQGVLYHNGQRNMF